MRCDVFCVYRCVCVLCGRGQVLACFYEARETQYAMKLTSKIVQEGKRLTKKGGLGLTRSIAISQQDPPHTAHRQGTGHDFIQSYWTIKCYDFNGSAQFVNKTFVHRTHACAVSHARTCRIRLPPHGADQTPKRSMFFCNGKISSYLATPRYFFLVSDQERIYCNCIICTEKNGGLNLHIWMLSNGCSQANHQDLYQLFKSQYIVYF